MSGVQPGDPIILHDYQNGQTYCGGHWYATGTAPCETERRVAAEALAGLPACEASDEDIVAAAALLGYPRASRCWTKDRASWADHPGSVITMATLKAQMESLKAVFAKEGRPAPTAIIIHPDLYRRLTEGNFDA